MKSLVSVYPWEPPKNFSGDVEVNKGDKVVVAKEQSNEIGVVVGAGKEENSGEKILRIATKRDIEIYKEHKKQERDCLDFCRSEIRRLNLEMKLIGCVISLDGKQVIMAFTADGRVDFRELVKALSGRFKKSVRLQQIGSRDEAKRLGGFGLCGRELCCVKLGGTMQSITTEMARVQQIAHRGSDRISGLCGRLMCCLAFESEQYKEMLKGMPEIYSSVSVRDGKGTVVEINAPLQEIKIKLENGKYLTVKKEDLI